MTAITPSTAPSASDPVSPIKTRAFFRLNHKHPPHPPASAAQTTAISALLGTYGNAVSLNAGYPVANANTINTEKTTASIPAASPSSPSIKLTALVMPTIQMMVR